MKKSGEQQRPIIKRVVKGHAEGHHGGAWKVAYADFTTSLLALFIVLWILAQAPEVRKSIETYFNDPRSVASLNPRANIDAQMSAGIMAGNPLSINDQKANRLILTPEEAAKDDPLVKAGKKLVEQIMKQRESSPLAEMIEVSITSEGLRIELSDHVEGTFFKKGSAQPTDTMKQALSLINLILTTVDNPIVIEGHTDSSGLPGSSSSNWELSAERANATRRMAVSLGLPEDRVKEIRAYADTRPRPGMQPSDARNRRVSFLAMKKDATQPEKADKLFFLK